MKILFVTFGELSVNGEDLRPVSILRALADAGHEVYVISARAEISSHPNIRFLLETESGRISRLKLQMAAISATGTINIDIVHAEDDAVIFSASLCRIRKIRLIYDATRCFSGPVAQEPSRRWKWFPEWYRNVEKKILQQADTIVTPCAKLTADIKNLYTEAKIVQVENVPAQSLFCGREVDRVKLLEQFEDGASSIVVCSVLPGNREEFRKILIAVRKVIEVLPSVVFFFKGNFSEEIRTMAANLDILKKCVFLSEHQTETFLATLDIADVSLLVPTPGNRYVHPEILTLLYAPAPVVVVQEEAYETILSDQNSVQVLSGSESIADGLLRMIQEPLLSIGLVSEGQQLIADHYSLSSFKHKIRMAYHEIMTK